MFKTLALLFLLSISSQRSLACSCGSNPPESCPEPKALGIIFVGTVLDIENPPDENAGPLQGGTSRYHFRVDENVHDMEAKEVDVYSGRGGADCSYHFRRGGTYLVFPYQSDNKLFAGICTDTQEVEAASPLLSELRARRDGKPHASLYGVVRRTQQPYDGTFNDRYDRPLPRVTVELRAPNQTFSTQTDDDGVYRFYSLPASVYRFFAKLPPNLELATVILDDSSAPRIDLPANACAEQDLTALPTAKIRGRVVAPDGTPLKYADVELFREGRYSDSHKGWWELQDPDRNYFEFNHVTPGKYIVVFHNSNRSDEDIPYQRTFYPSSIDLLSATPITIAGGQQILHADIHVRDARPTRKLLVRVHWGNKQVPDDVYLKVKGSSDECCSTEEKVSPGLFDITIFINSKYKIFAWQDCGRRWEGNTAYPIGERETETVEVDGANIQAGKVDLWLRDNGCRPYPKLGQASR